MGARNDNTNVFSKIGKYGAITGLCAMAFAGASMSAGAADMAINNVAFSNTFNTIATVSAGLSGAILALSGGAYVVGRILEQNNSSSRQQIAPVEPCDRIID